MSLIILWRLTSLFVNDKNMDGGFECCLKHVLWCVYELWKSFHYDFVCVQTDLRILFSRIWLECNRGFTCFVFWRRKSFLCFLGKLDLVCFKIFHMCVRYSAPRFVHRFKCVVCCEKMFFSTFSIGCV